MQTFRLIVLSILVVMLAAGTAHAQDSSYTVKLANAYLKHIDADKLVTSWTRLMKGEEGTDMNSGSPLAFDFKAGMKYTIAVIYSTEEIEELTLSCVYKKDNAKTDLPITIRGDNAIVTPINLLGLDAITLDVKKTGTVYIYVRGRKLPDDGVYYKLIISTF